MQEADDTRRKLPSEESEFVAHFYSCHCRTSWTLGPAHLGYHLHLLSVVQLTSLDSFPCWPALSTHWIPPARLDSCHSWVARSCCHPRRIQERKTTSLVDADFLVLHQWCPTSDPRVLLPIFHPSLSMSHKQWEHFPERWSGCSETWSHRIPAHEHVTTDYWVCLTRSLQRWNKSSWKKTSGWLDSLSSSSWDL